MIANKNILKRIDQLEMAAGLILNEATMLKQELSGVVFGGSSRKGNKKRVTSDAVSKRNLRRIK